jgi:hypothetical protein
MSAWLLWVVQHPSPLWQQYRRVLPAPQEVTCLLTFGPEDIPELQLPALQVGPHCCAADSMALYTWQQEQQQHPVAHTNQHSHSSRCTIMRTRYQSDWV